MSPEECEGRVMTEASDQYSLAAVAYEMLTGHPPFDAPTSAGIEEAHIAQRPIPLAEVRDDLPPALCATVHRGLEKQPSKRWPGIAAFAAAIASEVIANQVTVRASIVSIVASGADAIPVPPPAAPAVPDAPDAPPDRKARRSSRSRRKARRMQRRLRLIVAVLTVGGGITAGVMIPRMIRQRAQDARVAARVRNASSAGDRGATSPTAVSTRAVPEVSVDGPVRPLQVLGTPESCALIPRYTSADLKRRGRAFLRLCAGLDRTAVTVSGTPLGVSPTGVRDVEVDAGRITYSAQRTGCKTTEGSAIVVAGEYHVFSARKLSPTCTTVLPPPTR